MGKTNKIVLVLVIIFIICGFASVFVFGCTRSRVSPTNGKYVNRKFGFKITPPPNWEIKQMGDSHIMFYGPREKNLYIVLSISITDEVSENLENYVSAKKSRLTAPEYEFHSSRQIEIDDLEGYELIYTIMAKMKSVSKTWYEPFRKYKVVFLMKNSKRFRIAYVVTPSEYQTYLPIIDKSIGSFKFIDVP